MRRIEKKIKINKDKDKMNEYEEGKGENKEEVGKEEED